MAILDSPQFPEGDKPKTLPTQINPSQPDPITPPWYDHQPFPGEKDSVTSGGSGGGSGSSSGDGGGTTVDYSGPGKDYNDADSNARFLGVGGHPEVWKDSTTGQIFLVYFAAGTEPPVPLLYEVADEKALQALFGVGNTIVYDRTMTTEELKSTGEIKRGTAAFLADSEGDPWLGFLDRMEELREVSPWIDDDEMLALIGGAYLEGRPVQQWEIDKTDWARGKTDAEKTWLEKLFARPAEAEQDITNNKIITRDLFEKIGVSEINDELIAFMGNMFSTGQWSQEELVAQVEAVTSGWGEIDRDLQTFVNKNNLSPVTTQQNYEQVQSLYDEWLGPAYTPTQADVSKWATDIRNTGGADNLIQMLKNQRLALFPEYDNPNLSWRDISSPWKSMAQGMWGVPIADDDPYFQSVVRLNNANEAQKSLRKEGFDRGIDNIVNEVIGGIGSGMKSNVRGVV